MRLHSDRDLDLHEAEQKLPKYEQLKNHLLGELRAGRLRPGEALPTELELAGTLQIARSTVRRALDDLGREGLINRVRGRGTFISRDARRRMHSGLNAFALMVPETQGGHYPALLHGFEGAASRAHNQMLVSSTDNDVGRQGNIILQLLEKEVAGVAMVPATTPPTPAYQLIPLQRQGIPLVFCHRRVEGIQAPLLAIPFHQVCRMAGEALVAHGHRRVAYRSTRQEKTSEIYLQELRKTVRDAGGDVPEKFIFQGKGISPHVERLENEFREALGRMFSGPDRPTAIFSTFDSAAELIYLILGQMGLRVPEDVSLVGFGGTDRRGAILSRLTSVAISGEELGRRAGEILQEIRLGLRPANDNEAIHMPLMLIEGQTLGPARNT